MYVLIHQNERGLWLGPPWLDLGPNTLKSIQIHYSYFDLSMITIALQLQVL